MAVRYDFLNEKFLDAMNDIGRYGNAKWGNRLEDLPREHSMRFNSYRNAAHAEGHFAAYLRSEPHEYFGTRKHQLAAAAFNAMMEFYFAGLEDEPDTTCGINLVGTSSGTEKP